MPIIREDMDADKYWNSQSFWLGIKFSSERVTGTPRINVRKVTELKNKKITDMALNEYL